MSTETKVAHTPGPWKLMQESVDPEWHIITAAGGRIVANVHVEPGNEMDEANVRLLITAPDLLAACREALNATMYMFSRESGWDGLAKQLHDAIAKATGETD